MDAFSDHTKCANGYGVSHHVFGQVYNRYLGLGMKSTASVCLSYNLVSQAERIWRDGM